MSTARRPAPAAAATAALSERAKSSFDLLVQHALVKALSPEGEHGQAKIIQELPRKPKEKKAVVLTIASPEFRLVLALHVRLDSEGKRHFARLNRVEPDEWGEQAFVDAVSECGNICVGTMNRELGRHFLHVGMSTPNLLEREALAYLEALGAGHRRLYQVTGLGLDFYATLFVSAFVPLDFHAEVETAAEEADAGELEMF